VALDIASIGITSIPAVSTDNEKNMILPSMCSLQV
jgi:hypothetical protein